MTAPFENAYFYLSACQILHVAVWKVAGTPPFVIFGQFPLPITIKIGPSVQRGPTTLVGNGPRPWVYRTLDTEGEDVSILN